MWGMVSMITSAMGNESVANNDGINITIFKNKSLYTTYNFNI